MNDIPFWITATHWGSRSVLVLLALLSIWSVATMIQCHRLLQRARGGKDGDSIFAKLREQMHSGQIGSATSQGEEGSLYHAVVHEASGFKEPMRIDRSIKSLLTIQKVEIERGLTVLATLGANAPFIGLFGTVLGIIQAFGALGASQNTGASVMAGISEALIATAVGLFVAIPAVIAFNFFSRSLRVVLTNCESLRDLYIANMKG